MIDKSTSIGNRYLELDYQHKKNIDSFINQIASHQGTYKMDKAIMIAIHDAMEKIYNTYTKGDSKWLKNLKK